MGPLSAVPGFGLSDAQAELILCRLVVDGVDVAKAAEIIEDNRSDIFASSCHWVWFAWLAFG